MKSFKDLGFRNNSKKELFATYSIYLQNREKLKLIETEELVCFLNNLKDSYDKSAIEKYLDEECPFKLYPFQKEFVYWYNNPEITSNGCFNASEAGLGKAQPISEPILTPEGWKNIGDVKAGDYTFTETGLPTKILGVFPQGKKAIYKITFSDGTFTRCCEDHLWTIRKQRDKWETLPLKDFKDKIKSPKGRRRYSIKTTEAVSYKTKSLPINPYILGVLLGDGGLTGVNCNISSADPELISYVAERLDSDYRIIKKKNSKIEYSIVRNTYKVSSFMKHIKEFKLNDYSYNKHIPEIYLRSDIGQRTELFQGLIDTDGHIFESNIEYSTSSKQLALDMQDLAEGLGCKVTIVERTTKHRNNFRVYIKPSKNLIPCKLNRKLKSYIKRTKYKELYRYFEKIELENYKEEAVCISVESKTKTYLTKNHIVTHNTIMSLAAVFAKRKDQPLIILCPKNAINVWIDHLKKFNYSLPIKRTFDPGECACILTYESLNPTRREALTSKAPIENFTRQIPKGIVVIADEFHKTKSSKTKMTKRFKKLFSIVKSKNGKCVALTATPIMNRPSEFKTLLENLDLFKISFGNSELFSRLYGGEFDFNNRRMVWDTTKRDSEEIHKRVYKYIFIKKKEEVYDQLPDKQETFYKVPLKEKYAKQFPKEKAQRLLANTNSPSFHIYMKLRETLSIEKLKESMELFESFEEQDKQIVVFSCFQKCVKELGSRKGWAYIDGSVPAHKRAILASKFNAGQIRNLAIATGSGATALSLTCTDTMVFLDLDLVPSLNYQARERINRINAIKKALHYIYIVSDHPFEESMTKLILEKEQLIRDTI